VGACSKGQGVRGVYLRESGVRGLGGALLGGRERDGDDGVDNRRL